MKKLFLSLLMLVGIWPMVAHAQIYMMKDSKVSFYSDAPLEDIEATTTGTQGVINVAEKNFSFRVPIASFKFEKELMQEHFNENYMESEKFPYGTFKGAIDGKYNIKKDGDYPVMARGVLNIHGIDQKRDLPATIHVKNGEISIESKFMVRLEDHKIEIPTIVFHKIAEEVEVKVNSTLALYNN